MRRPVSLLALVAISANAAPPQGTGLAVLLKGEANAPGGVLLVRDGQAPRRIADEQRRPLSWSTDGRHLLVLGPGGALELVDSLLANPAPKELGKAVESAHWSPTGDWLVFASPTGIFRHELKSDRTERILPVGQQPVITADGRRVLFVRGGAEEGVWIMDRDGSDPHRVLRGLVPASVQPSPDGRRLAVVARATQGLELIVGGIDGRSRESLGAVSGPWIRWSPSGTLVSAEDEARSTVIEVSTRRRTPVESDLRPQWVGARRLLTVRAGTLSEVSFRGEQSSRVALGDVASLAGSRGELVALSQGTGLIFGESEANPFRDVGRPRRGQIRLEGYVVDLDPILGQVTVATRAVTDAQGRELNLAEPRIQNLRLARGAQRETTGVLESVRITDFRIESEVSILASGGALGAPMLTAERVRIAGFMQPGQPSAVPQPGRPVRPRRFTEYDGVSMDRVVVPMAYPIFPRRSLADTFLYPRDGGRRRHHGQDLMAPKMTPLLATFDGLVSFARSRGGGHNILYLTGDNGYGAYYMHINNDTPGTDDGAGSERYAFAPGLQSGDRVVAGQFIAWCGDSGNAERTGAHLHFELHDDVGGGVLNAYPSLKAAREVAPVYRAFPFGERPRPGEIRWEAVVADIDPRRQILVADLVAVVPAGKAGRAITRPQRIFLPVKDVPIRFHNLDDLKLTLTDMKRGLRVVAAGRADPAGKVTSVRSVVVDLL